ncbi:acyl-CoA dehydratase activase [Chloroflexota bacterium]
MVWSIGIDIGSVASKGVIARDNKLLAYYVIPSGTNYRAVAHKLKQELLEQVGLSSVEIVGIGATGCGASNVDFANLQISDIVCCAKGIKTVFPLVRTVINIGGQCSQVIQIDDEGRVADFAVTEKCAAGSARFLQVIANVLRVDLKDIGPLSLKSKNPVSFSTGCAVFGETEAVTRVAEGFSKEDILAGVYKSLADKIVSLVAKVRLEEQCAISGGGGLDIGLVKSLEEKLQVPLLVPPQPQIITALGAAVITQEKQKKRSNLKIRRR